MSGDITGALPYTITVGGKFTVGRKEREKDCVNNNIVLHSPNTNVLTNMELIIYVSVGGRK